MPYRPEPERKQPDFSSLEVSLVQSRSQLQNNSLFQTLYLLIKRIILMQTAFINVINDAVGDLSVIFAARFLTSADETLRFPNSRQLIAGFGIAFDDTVAGRRTISTNITDGYWTPLTDGDVDETDIIYANGEAIAVFVPV